MNSKPDVFVRDLPTLQTIRASVGPSGQGGNDYSWRPSISGRGEEVAFYSQSWNLVANDQNGFFDVFLHEVNVPPAAGRPYCTAKVNGLGCVPSIWTTGYPTLTGSDDFHITAQDVLNQKSGIFFWGLAPYSAPFVGGTRCVKYPVHRTPVQNSGGSAPPTNNCSGTYSFHFAQPYMAHHGLAVGTCVFGQYWSRDRFLPPPNNFGLTNGIEFVIAP